MSDFVGSIATLTGHIRGQELARDRELQNVSQCLLTGGGNAGLNGRHRREAVTHASADFGRLRVMGVNSAGSNELPQRVVLSGSTSEGN